MKDPLLESIEKKIAEEYGCHTIILYGSRARGEATDSSDYDICAIRDKGKYEHDCRFYEGHYLDIFIYSEKAILKPEASLIRIKDGIVLRQKENIGDELLKKITEVFNAALKPGVRLRTLEKLAALVVVIDGK